jgi:hypothetical protein
MQFIKENIAPDIMHHASCPASKRAVNRTEAPGPSRTCPADNTTTVFHRHHSREIFLLSPSAPESDTHRDSFIVMHHRISISELKRQNINSYVGYYEEERCIKLNNILPVYVRDGNWAGK